MEIVGESKGFDKDKYIHSYFIDQWLHLFPKLGSQTTFLRQAANLWSVKQEIRKNIVQKLLPSGSKLSIVDDFPIPVCGFRRAHFQNYSRKMRILDIARQKIYDILVLKDIC